MNLQHLKYVVEVEKTGSITQAAQNLYMGQPNLSKAIRELEKNLGIVLFKRTSKGVLPTAQGEEFLRYAKSILEQVERMENLYRFFGERTRFSVSVLRADYIAYAFGRFLCRTEESQWPDIRLKETDSGTVIQDVVRRESGLGIIRCPADQENSLRNLLTDQSVASRPLWDFTCQVLFSQNHPLAKAAFEPEDLCLYPQILCEDPPFPGLSDLDNGRREKPSAGKKIRVCERGSRLELLRQVPGSYAWTSPVPPAMLDRYGLAQRNCGAGVRAKDLLIYLEGYRPNSWEEAFLQELAGVWEQTVPPGREKEEKGGRF